MITLYNGDMLIEMNKIADNSVDMILTDLPYGTTASSWDEIIPFDKMWEQYNRVIKEKGAIVLTASQPFSSRLVSSNINGFKHEWVWEKESGVGFQIAKYRPMQKHESVLVFTKGGGTMNYYPIMEKRDKPITSSGASSYSGTSPLANISKQKFTYTHRYPSSILEYTRDKGKHPTQKPVALLEYLIKTYTNKGETVLDSTMGSGSTGVACKRTDRKFIGIEMDEDYFKIAKDRIAKTQFIQEALDI